MKHSKLLIGNNIDLLKTIPDSTVDLIPTSPPYDNRRTYHGFPPLDLYATGVECFRVLKEGGVMAVVIQDATIKGRKTLTKYRLVMDYCEKIGFNLFDDPIWQRHGLCGEYPTRFRTDYENIFLFVKGKKPKHFDKTHLMVPTIYGGQLMHGFDTNPDGSKTKRKPRVIKDLKCSGNVWSIPNSSHEHNKYKSGHPATFPDRLIENIIRCFTNEGEVVLDPFNGSGTTCAMALKHNRQFIGMEFSEIYTVVNAFRRIWDMSILGRDIPALWKAEILVLEGIFPLSLGDTLAFFDRQRDLMRKAV